MGDHPGMARLPPARWWTIRPARNRSPKNYVCPLCGYRLHAMTDHVLIAPEGDADGRRHAHTECVAAARAQGRLPLRDEWLATQPRAPSRLRRLFGRAR
jgi:hypothetical protein